MQNESKKSVDFASIGFPDIETMNPSINSMDPSELISKLKLFEDLKPQNDIKPDKRLYVGNIPAGLTVQMLMDLLNSALEKMGINIDPAGGSIVSAWVSPDHKYAFIEFRTPEEATNGLALSNVAISGQTLNVGRPKINPQIPNVENFLQASVGSSGISFNQVTTTQNKTPSRVVVLKNMVKISELEIDEEFSDIYEDVMEECQKFGNILSMNIPRPESGYTVTGLGNIFIEYSTPNEAKAAIDKLHGRYFAGNTITALYYDEEKYATNDLSKV